MFGTNNFSVACMAAVALATVGEATNSWNKGFKLYKNDASLDSLAQTSDSHDIKRVYTPTLFS